jgi:hypothetical protein
MKKGISSRWLIGGFAICFGIAAILTALLSPKVQATPLPAPVIEAGATRLTSFNTGNGANVEVYSVNGDIVYIAVKNGSVSIAVK